MFNAPRTGARTTNFSSPNPFGGGGGIANGIGSNPSTADPLAQSAYAPEVDDPWGSTSPKMGGRDISASVPNLMGGGGGAVVGSGSREGDILPEHLIPSSYINHYNSLDTGAVGDISLSSLHRLLSESNIPPSAIERIVGIAQSAGGGSGVGGSTLTRGQFFVLMGLVGLVQTGKEPTLDSLLRTNPLPIPSLGRQSPQTQSSSHLSAPTPPPAPSRGFSATLPSWNRQESFRSTTSNASNIPKPNYGDADPESSMGFGGVGSGSGLGGGGGELIDGMGGGGMKGWWKDVENCEVSILEKEGYFLQKYRVESDKRPSGPVIRRYSDFLWLLDVLSKRYPCRLLPNLPPKRVGPDQAFLEQRRKGLKRFLNFIVNHPIIRDDGALAVFMTEPNFEAWRKRVKVATDDESVSKKLDSAAEMRIPSDLDEKLGVMRESLPLLLEGHTKLVVLAEKSLKRIEAASGDQSRIAMTLATLGERHPESCWRCAGQEAGRGGGIGGNGCDLCKGVGRGLGAIGEAWAREGEESDKRVKALTTGSLEALKVQRDLYIAFRDLLGRHDRLIKDNVDVLRKRAEAAQKKLDTTRSAKRPGWEAAAEKLVTAIEQDNSAITTALTRRVFIKHCIWHELSIVLHSRQAAQLTLGWRQYSAERAQAAVGTSEIWKGLAERLQDMPVD